jgi:hypothetical protein
VGLICALVRAVSESLPESRDGVQCIPLGHRRTNAWHNCEEV